MSIKDMKIEDLIDFCASLDVEYFGDELLCQMETPLEKLVFKSICECSRNTFGTMRTFVIPDKMLCIIKKVDTDNDAKRIIEFLQQRR